jgi:hypothetical protein
MDFILSLLYPFSNMNDACIGIQIIMNYESIKKSTIIISQYFKITYEYDDIEMFFGRVQTFPTIFPLNFIKNIEHNMTQSINLYSFLFKFIF